VKILIHNAAKVFSLLKKKQLGETQEVL